MPSAPKPATGTAFGSSPEWMDGCASSQAPRASRRHRCQIPPPLTAVLEVHTPYLSLPFSLSSSPGSQDCSKICASPCREANTSSPTGAKNSQMSCRHNPRSTGHQPGNLIMAPSGTGFLGQDAPMAASAPIKRNGSLSASIGNPRV